MRRSFAVLRMTALVMSSEIAASGRALLTMTERVVFIAVA